MAEYFTTLSLGENLPQYKNLTYSNSYRKNGSGVSFIHTSKIQQQDNFVEIGGEKKSLDGSLMVPV